MFVASSASVAIVTVVPLNDLTLSVLLAAAFGFLLSQDVFTVAKSPIYLLSFVWNAKFLQSIRIQMMTKTFVSFAGLDCRPLLSMKSLAIHYLLSAVKGMLLLAASLVIIYYSFTSNGDSEDLGAKITGGLVIGSFCLLQGSHLLQRVYLVQVLRNPLFPKQSESVTKFSKRRKLLLYLSIPGRILCTYGKLTYMCMYIFQTYHNAIHIVYLYACFSDSTFADIICGIHVEDIEHIILHP